MSMKMTLSEFCGMNSWSNEKLCRYVNLLDRRIDGRDALIRDMLDEMEKRERSGYGCVERRSTYYRAIADDMGVILFESEGE